MAWISDVHLHQTRQTFARSVSGSSGSIIETQDALGYKNAATTRAYAQWVVVKEHRHGTTILGYLDV